MLSKNNLLNVQGIKTKAGRNARKARGLPKFDPEGSGYDMRSALKAGMRRDKKTGRMDSRNPKTGQLLKGRKHRTFPETVAGEKALGYEIYKGDDGKYFSRKAIK
jgi:hypothetical protein